MSEHSGLLTAKSAAGSARPAPAAPPPTGMSAAPQAGMPVPPFHPPLRLHFLHRRLHAVERLLGGDDRVAAFVLDEDGGLGLVRDQELDDAVHVEGGVAGG